MSYKKTYTKKPKPSFKKTPSFKPVDKRQDQQIAKIQKQLIAFKPEMKYKDYNNFTAPTSGFIGFNYTVVGQGNDFNQRIGEEIRAAKLDLFITLTRPATTTTSCTRTIVLWDKQANGSAVIHPLTSLSLVEGIIDDTTIVAPNQAPFNDRAKERYVVLYEKFNVFNPDTTTNTQRKIMKKTINLSHAIIKYSDSGAIPDSITSRALYVCHYGLDIGGVITNHTTTGRLWYTDV